MNQPARHSNDPYSNKPTTEEVCEMRARKKCKAMCPPGSMCLGPIRTTVESNKWTGLKGIWVHHRDSSSLHLCVQHHLQEQDWTPHWVPKHPNKALCMICSESQHFIWHNQCEFCHLNMYQVSNTVYIVFLHLCDSLNLIKYLKTWNKLLNILLYFYTARLKYF